MNQNTGVSPLKRLNIYNASILLDARDIQNVTKKTEGQQSPYKKSLLGESSDPRQSGLQTHSSHEKGVCVCSSSLRQQTQHVPAMIDWQSLVISQYQFSTIIFFSLKKGFHAAVSFFQVDLEANEVLGVFVWRAKRWRYGCASLLCPKRAKSALELYGSNSSACVSLCGSCGCSHASSCRRSRSSAAAAAQSEGSVENHVQRSDSALQGES